VVRGRIGDGCFENEKIIAKGNGRGSKPVGGPPWGKILTAVEEEGRHATVWFQERARGVAGAGGPRAVVWSATTNR